MSIRLQSRHDGDARAAVRCSVAQTTVSVGTGSTQILAQNIDRCYLLIQNQGANDLYLSFGADATEAGGFKLAAGATFEPRVAPVEALWGLMDTAAGDCIVLEGV